MQKSLLLLLILTIACNHNAQIISNPAALQSIKIIVFGKTDLDAGVLQQQLNQLSRVPVTISYENKLPAVAWCEARNRYLADSLLLYLQQHKKLKGEYVLGFTAKDISIGAGSSNWGIMGLGYCPGSVCIVSEYRLKYKSTRLLQRQERLLQLALHELGHNFSLPHCPNVNCLMVAAKGKMTLDGHKYYCSKCSAVLTKKGILLRDRQRV
ncbi:MAG: hypothetical protein RLZZ316_1785 [Bacteroidota bacterium]